MQSSYLPEHIFLTDQATIAPEEALRKLPHGSIIILRDYDMAEKPREELAWQLKRLCREHGSFLLIGKTPELARKISADGVHLPEFMAKQAPGLRRKNPGWFITSAAHTRNAAYKAAGYGIDAVLISPVFYTKSHPDARPLGLHRAKKAIFSPIFAYALGGVKSSDLFLLKAIGFQGVAGISSFK